MHDHACCLQHQKQSQKLNNRNDDDNVQIGSSSLENETKT